MFCRLGVAVLKKMREIEMMMIVVDSTGNAQARKFVCKAYAGLYPVRAMLNVAVH